jgi:hypothetical protein
LTLLTKQICGNKREWSLQAKSNICGKGKSGAYEKEREAGMIEKQREREERKNEK